MFNIFGSIAFIVLAPLLGGLLAGVDRVITARMQSRKGPPVLQPFYDFFKLWEKAGNVVHPFQNMYMWCFLIFTVISGALFFGGGDLLVVVFGMAVSGVFFAMGAFSTNSPFSNIGAERELLQVMAYEPMVLIAVLGFFLIPGNGSFKVADILSQGKPALLYMPGIFFGFLYVLTIKLRKSPFDLSTSHHAHQELVKGVTTDYSGRGLAIIEIGHWYENILILGIVYLFFIPLSPVLAVVATLVTYLLEILVDNTNARLKWQLTVRSSWMITALFGVTNLLILFYIRPLFS